VFGLSHSTGGYYLVYRILAKKRMLIGKMLVARFSGTVEDMVEP